MDKYALYFEDPDGKRYLCLVGDDIPLWLTINEMAQRGDSVIKKYSLRNARMEAGRWAKRSGLGVLPTIEKWPVDVII